MVTLGQLHPRNPAMGMKMFVFLIDRSYHYLHFSKTVIATSENWQTRELLKGYRPYHNSYSLQTTKQERLQKCTRLHFSWFEMILIGKPYVKYFAVTSYFACSFDKHIGGLGWILLSSIKSMSRHVLRISDTTITIRDYGTANCERHISVAMDVKLCILCICNDITYNGC